MTYWAYDEETYPNWFSIGFEDLHSDQRFIFEMSERYDHADQLWAFVYDLQQRGDTLVGFNNNGFDMPVLQHFMNLCYNGIRPTYIDTYAKAQAIIDAPRGDWSQTLWDSDHLIKNIDLFALMHFNRLGQGVSLKKLEVAMRSATVKDLPLKPGLPVPPELYDPMNSYMAWDVGETKKFAHLIWDRIEFRQKLDSEGTFGHRSCINWNDVKIGSEYLLSRLKKRGVQLYAFKKKRQTPRNEGIRFIDFLPPVPFDSPELQRIYQHFAKTQIRPDETKGYFEGLNATLTNAHGSIKLDFGTGGLHGAVASTTWHSDANRVIRLDDVESYYPRLSVTRGFFPEHLTEAFLEEYDLLFQMRKQYDKGTMENGLYKLALNGSFGKLNDIHSNLYDPQAMLAITVTGQLFLARLTEVLMTIPSLQMMQVNTDGVAYIVDRADEALADDVCQWWMEWTGLKLGRDYYDFFAQRDVNSYVTIDPDGKVKTKGAYTPVAQRQYHQDMSAGVLQIAVLEFLTKGTPLADTIYNHTDPFDFMLAYKVDRSSRMEWGGEEVQKINRYYIAIDGKPLNKIMPPVKGGIDERYFQINKGWVVGMCNEAWRFDWTNLNRRWYLDEAEALVNALG